MRQTPQRRRIAQQLCGQSTVENALGVWCIIVWECYTNRRGGAPGYTSSSSTRSSLATTNCCYATWDICLKTRRISILNFTNLKPISAPLMAYPSFFWEPVYPHIPNLMGFPWILVSRKLVLSQTGTETETWRALFESSRKLFGTCNAHEYKENHSS